MEQSSPMYDLSSNGRNSPPFSIRIVERAKRECRDSPFSRGVIFTRTRVSLALLSLRKNGDYSQ